MDKKIRLGGIKVLDGRSHLTAWRQGFPGDPGAICARLAADRINLSHVTYISAFDSGPERSVTAFCTESAQGFHGYFHLKVEEEQAGGSVTLQPDVSILSVFPHERRPHIPGRILKMLAGKGIRPFGLASSPSALSVLIATADTKSLIDGLFDIFEFPKYRSPLEWHAAYEGREQMLEKVVCSYEEQIIKVYNVSHQADLDYWGLLVSAADMDSFGEAAVALDRLELRVPFLVAESCEEDRLFFAFCFESVYREEVQQIFQFLLPRVDIIRRHPVASFFLVGPHFGDRHGIIHSLLETLTEARVSPLAISCSVSSVSAVVPAENLLASLKALGTRFQIPNPESPDRVKS
jgi:aspartokinase